MSNDNIKEYTMTVHAGVQFYCRSCSEMRPVWCGITEDDVKLICCGTCQRVIVREVKS